MKNALHDACLKNQLTKVKTLLVAKSHLKDECTSHGMTPLMISCDQNSSRLVKTLLANKASTAPVNKLGQTALMMSSQDGFLHLVKMLVKAGADMEAKDTCGKTSLHLAADDLQVEVMEALLKAGADPDSCTANGVTPLHTAAGKGMLKAVTTLFGGGANMSSTINDDFVPLDIAAAEGHEHVVRWMLCRGGLNICGGKSKGVRALTASAENGHVEVMQVLTDAGVRDTGEALRMAILCAQVDPVRILLKQYEIFCLDYINNKKYGKTLLTNAIEGYKHESAPRIVRWLLDAGASTTSRASRVYLDEFSYTPVEWTYRLQLYREDHMEILEAVRRPLLQEHAVHAKSWLWGNTDTESIDTIHPTTPMALRLVRRSRGDTSRVVLRGLSRYCRKTDDLDEEGDEEGKFW